MSDFFSPDARGGELVFYDLEMTAWPGSQERDWSETWEHREIIQIGAVRVRDDAALTEIDRMLCHVTPAINPTLSDYIVELTGIEQSVIEAEGFDFDEALTVFMEFGAGARAVLAYGADRDILAENCALNDLPVPDLARFGSAKDLLAVHAGSEFGASTSHDLPTLVGLEPTGRAHDAMDDAECVAATIRALRARGVL